MTRISLVLLLATAVLSAQSPAQNPPRALFSAHATDLVVLPVAIMEGDGHFISGLTRDQFTVYDNGRRQSIALFTNEDTPVALGLVIDDSSSMGPKLGEVVAAAIALARSSNPDDQVFALDFNDRVHDVIAERTILANNTQALNTALSRMIPQGRTALYDAILAALDREVEGGGASRKVLVVISDGGDNASTATLDAVLKRARQANVTIYTIGLFDEGDRDSNPGVLKKLAVETGGERFLPASPGPLLQDVEHIAREIRSGYTLGFAPPDRDGQYHRIRVTIDAPNAKRLTVRTRPGYFAPATAASEP